MVEMTRLVDAGLIMLAMLLAIHVLSLEWETMHTSITLAAFIVYSFSASYLGLYRSWRVSPMRKEIGLAWLSWVASILWVMFFAYSFDISEQIDHSLMLLWFGLAFATLAGFRIVVRVALRWLRWQGRNYRTVAIVGATDIGARVEHNLRHMAWTGMHLLGTFDDHEPDPDRVLASDIKLQGDVQALIKRAQAGDVDIVYITLPMGEETKIKNIVSALGNTTVTIYFVPDFSLFDLLHARWEMLGTIQLVSLVDTPNKGYGGMLKTSFDFFAASVLLCLLALPLLLVAVGVYLSSPGPVIFKQTRYGLNGKEFKIWKFRTMTVCEDRDQFRQAVKNDPRVTRFGMFLRKTSIDELPQLFNVLFGDMSIVGPRPHPVALNDQQRHLIDRYMQRYKVKPGITGWAQVNGARGETDTLDKIHRRILLDLEYIDNWSIWLDLKIILKTLRIVINDANAY